MSRDRQIAHAREPHSASTTLCGRTVAGSMEIDQRAPTCPTCRLKRAVAEANATRSAMFLPGRS